jgi:hypothetical protein
MLQFTKATKTQAKARIALIGPSGSGKTYSSLAIATGLGDTVAVIDTEHGSASKYAGEFEFSTLELTTFSPDTYVNAIHAAEKAGFDVLIIDSLSHAWMGAGGALEMVDNETKRSRSQNSFTAWGKVTPKHRRLIDTIVGSKCHIIATMRSKTEYVIEQVNGKNVPRKIGMAAVQRDGMEYEFDITADLNLEHTLMVSKTRCLALDGAVIDKPGREFGETIKTWLSDGVPMPEPIAPPHWSEDTTKRQVIADTLGKAGVAIEYLFRACGVTDWEDMKRYEDTGANAIMAAKSFAAKNSKKVAA